MQRETRHKNSEVAGRSVHERSLWLSSVLVSVFGHVLLSASLKLEPGPKMAVRVLGDFRAFAMGDRWRSGGVSKILNFHAQNGKSDLSC